jgi:structural maintenance of chromosome 2
VCASHLLLLALPQVEDTKLFVTHRFAKKLVAAKVAFNLHVIVGPTDTDSVAALICKKAEDLSAECVVMARHRCAEAVFVYEV